MDSTDDVELFDAQQDRLASIHEVGRTGTTMTNGIFFGVHPRLMLYLTASKPASAWRAASVSGNGTRQSEPGDASGSSGTPGLA
jgi:hypothetical protein